MLVVHSPFDFLFLDLQFQAYKIVLTYWYAPQESIAYNYEILSGKTLLWLFYNSYIFPFSTSTDMYFICTHAQFFARFVPTTFSVSFFFVKVPVVLKDSDIR